MHTILHGDCLELLSDLPDDSFEAIITDPPYGLTHLPPGKVADTIERWAAGETAAIPSGKGWMGNSWDAFVPPPAVWRQCLRVLKPGGHLAAFAGARTLDLMGYSIHTAGFALLPGLDWLYGQGLPKSLDVGKAIDKRLGATRRCVVEGPAVKRMVPGAVQQRTKSWVKSAGRTYTPQITEPATCQARQWDGWGSALKPAHEPIVLAWKPDGGVASLANHSPRFLYAAKATAKERPIVDGVQHTTVKPLAVMEWLIALLSVPGEHLLDPFAGSGTTLEAAVRLGRAVTVMEREAKFIPLIEHRARRATA